MDHHPHHDLDVEAGQAEEEASHPSAEELRNAEPLTFALLEVVTVLYLTYKVPRIVGQGTFRY